MEPIDFWSVNSVRPFGADFAVWNARYVGTLDDFARYEAQIRDGFARHATRKGQALIELCALADGDGFIVFGVAR